MSIIVSSTVDVTDELRVVQSIADRLNTVSDIKFAISVIQDNVKDGSAKAITDRLWDIIFKEHVAECKDLLDLI